MTRVGGRQEEAAQELRILSEAGEVAAQALDQWGLLRVRQGRVADASTLRERLVGEHPASPEAAEVLYLKGMAAESGGRTAEALSQYERLVENAPTSTRAALAHLRAGRIHLERGARSSAADKFDAYIEAFPDRSGRGEASYWSARARLETGDTVRGRAVLRAFLEHDPIDYYGVIGAELLGVTFDPDFRERAEPPPPPPRMDARGFARRGPAHRRRHHGRSRRDRGGLIERAHPTASHVLRLAGEIISRGYTIQGINLGWDLRDRGIAWDRRLLSVVFPLPRRERLLREAAEWGVDPWLVAGMIRQESAWDEDIVSPAGAVGLMQLMPATGRELARRIGPDDFSLASLEVADLNMHLGIAYLTEMLRRYEQLPLVLSAYNAGPGRANRWRSFPEASDPVLFTERIPFAETKDYVKRVRRNQAIYGHLYRDR